MSEPGLDLGEGGRRCGNKLEQEERSTRHRDEGRRCANAVTGGTI